MTVQDAEPADEHWLGRLLAGFDDDRVAAVCGQQIVPHDPDKNPVAWFRPVDPPGIKRVSFPNVAAFEALPAAGKRALCSWDNVNALYRRDILERIPFRKTDFAEDALWAADALRAGYHLVYNTAARVRHYHFETPDLAFRRSFTEMYHEYKFFGLTPAPPKDGWTALLRTIRLLLKARTIGWGAKWKWLVYNRQQRKAVGRAVQAFTTALEKGEEQLDILHRQICKKPPQALKPAAMQATYEQQR
jgi:rhamnosyltransferase